MALERIVKYSEKDIEDWLYANPDKANFIEGWIDRQIPLCNGTILDLLGYSGMRLVLVELKSNNLKYDDLIQVKRYEKYLIDTIENIDLSSLYVDSILIGSGNISKDFLEAAEALDVQVFKVSINNHNNIELSDSWRFNRAYYDDLIARSKSALSSGKYIKLINYLLPKMPSYLQEQYRELQ